MSFKFSQASKNNMIGVNPDLITVAQLALSISYIDFGIPTDGGYRSVKTQRVLFENKKSQCDGVIKRSKHQDGKALDFYAYVNGKASWDLQHLTIVAAAFMEAAQQLNKKIEWGGHWKSFRDYPHIQLST
jgi:peptidoglycan L-alanyl-D-glutamate endopeptidase CwlK